MKVIKVITRFSEAPTEPSELRRVARSLGRELPQQRIDTLREFRTRLACQPLADNAATTSIDEVSFATGYVEGMLDVTAEYEDSVRENEYTDELPSDVARGIRIAVDLFHHMITNPFGAAAALEEAATRMLGDSVAGAQAVELWASESRAAGLIRSPGATSQTSDSVRESGAIPNAMLASGSQANSVPPELLWKHDSEHNGHATTPPAKPSMLRAMTEPPHDDSSEEDVTAEVIPVMILA